MHCPNCSKRKYIKNGFIGACQRYKCKKCGHNFTKGTKHGYILLKAQNMAILRKIRWTL